MRVNTNQTVVAQNEMKEKEQLNSTRTTLLVEDEQKQRKRENRLTLIGQIVLGIVLIACWELFTRLGLLDPYYWSSPFTILQTGITAWTEGTLIQDLLYTSGATILGFTAGTLAGALLGLSFWWSNLYSKITEPYIVAFNAIPKLALAPVLVILFGIGFSSKVVLAFLMTVIVTAIAAYSGVKSVDKDLENMLYSLGAKRWHVFTKIVVPSSMPWIVSSLKINIALALAGTIVGEFIASRQGIGRMILYAGQIMNINLVWVGVTVLSVLSILMYLGTVWLERWLLKGMRH
jgi:NitT/TauT family transport system permease protein